MLPIIEVCAAVSHGWHDEACHNLIAVNVQWPFDYGRIERWCNGEIWVHLGNPVAPIESASQVNYHSGGSSISVVGKRATKVPCGCQEDFVRMSSDFAWIRWSAGISISENRTNERDTCRNRSTHSWTIMPRPRTPSRLLTCFLIAAPLCQGLTLMIW